MSALELVKYVQYLLDEYTTISFIILVAIMSLIQITPIKLNPWTAIGRLVSLIGKWFSRDTLTRLDEIDKKLDNVSEAVDDNEIDRIRWEIISLSSSLQRGINHSSREFERIFKLNTKYHNILKKANKENGEIDREIEYIEQIYAEKKLHDSFLK